MVKQIGEVLEQAAVTVLSQVQTGKENVWARASKHAAGMDRNVFTELMNGLWKGAGKKDYPDGLTIQVWYLGVGDLTEDQFTLATMLYLRHHSKQFLTIELIRELSGVQQAKEMAAIVAWDVALRAIQYVGGYCVPQFDDPVISNVISSLGGWVWFCDQDPGALRTFVRQRFVKTYEALAHGPLRIQPAGLKSLIDQTGGRSEVVRIGQSRPVERVEHMPS